MKIEITTTPKDFEHINCMISTTVYLLKEFIVLREAFDMSEEDVQLLDKFRKKFVKGFVKAQK